MKNTIIYFYDMFITTIYQQNKDYYFNYQNNNYILFHYDQSIEEVKDIYDLNVEMINKKIPVHQIILTKYKNIIITHNDKNYILMKIIISNRNINYNDIQKFKYLFNKKNLTKLNKSSWSNLWENKIDFYEYQFTQISNKYPLLKESINYYIGLCENAIAYFNSIERTNIVNQYICHRRIKVDDDLINFYNPLNFVIDYKERDIAEYIKDLIITKKISITNALPLVKTIPLQKENAMLLMSRLLFPSTYFDQYENIVLNDAKEETILNVVNNKDVIKLISFLYKYYSNNNINIPIINWIIKED